MRAILLGTLGVLALGILLYFAIEGHWTALVVYGAVAVAVLAVTGVMHESAPSAARNWSSPASPYPATPRSAPGNTSPPAAACGKCSGSGVHWVPLANGSGSVEIECPVCHGFGRM